MGSLKLSMLTGPNEGYVMAERGIFGVTFWESLSPDLKSRVAIDLAPAMFPRTSAEALQNGKFRAVLSAKSERVRKELREALLATGFSPKEIEKQHWDFSFDAKNTNLPKGLRTTKSVRWANPFFKVFGKTPPPVPITRRVPDGTRVYCVGDIHGRDDLLREMAERVEADMEVRSFDHAVTVFLGDYVDRGLGSMRVVERLARSEWPTPMIALAGNHEDLLMAFLEDEWVLECLAKPGWARNPAFLWGGCRPGHGWTRFWSSSSCIRGRVSRTPSALP